MNKAVPHDRNIYLEDDIDYIGISLIFIDSQQPCSLNMFSPVVSNNIRKTLCFEDSPVQFRKSVFRNLFETEKCMTPLNGKFNIFSEELQDSLRKVCTHKQVDYETPTKRIVTKRRRPSVQPNSKRRHEEDTSCKKTSIVKAVEKVAANEALCGDGSTVHSLPTTKGKHTDLRSITHHTLCDLMDSQFKDSFDNYTIIDCRYPYEYEAGHIEGAVNLYTTEMVETLLNKSEDNKKTVLVFHCEFSSERGPKMLRHLRAKARQINAENYPHLNYPEIYLLEGGYKEFFTHQLNHCFPKCYKPMLHKDHEKELKYFRSKTKSRRTIQRKCLRF